MPYHRADLHDLVSEQFADLGCSERLAQVQLSVEQDPDLTFAPAVNDRSMRMAISKELREVREDMPLANRLTSRHPPRLTAGLLCLSMPCLWMHNHLACTTMFYAICFVPGRKHPPFSKQELFWKG